MDLTKNINPKLKCPMNCLSTMELNKYRNRTTTLPMSEFFIKYKLDKDRKTVPKGGDVNFKILSCCY